MFKGRYAIFWYMLKINNYLEKFKNISVPSEGVRKDVSQAIKDEIGLELEVKNISIKNMVIYVKCDSSAKSEIFLRKNKILDRLKKAKKNEEILDIR